MCQTKSLLLRDSAHCKWLYGNSRPVRGGGLRWHTADTCESHRPSRCRSRARSQRSWRGTARPDRFANSSGGEEGRLPFCTAQRSSSPGGKQRQQETAKKSTTLWAKVEEREREKKKETTTELDGVTDDSRREKNQNKTCQLVRQRRDKTSRLTAAAERRGPVRTRRTSCGCFWHRRPPPESGRGCIVSPGGRCRPKTRLMCQHIIIV